MTRKDSRSRSEARAVSAAELARLFGRHRNTVIGWIDDGAPLVQRARREDGAQHLLDPAAVLAWLLRREREREAERWRPKLERAERAAGLAQPGEGELSAAEWTRRKRRAEARLREVELAKLEESLLPADEVEAASAWAHSAVQAAVAGQLPARAAYELATHFGIDARRAKAVIEPLAWECLEALAELGERRSSLGGDEYGPDGGEAEASG